MPSTSEVGHAKNVANLQKLTEQVTVLQPLQSTCWQPKSCKSTSTLYYCKHKIIRSSRQTKHINKNAITLRQSAFENLKSTCTRIINLLEILGLPQGTLDQAKSLNSPHTRRTKENHHTTRRRRTTNQHRFHLKTILHPTSR